MTLFTQSILAIALASPASVDCSLKPDSATRQRVFTNADLERMSACRYQTGAQSEVGTKPPQTPSPSRRRTTRDASPAEKRLDDPETDWRAQWRAVDQKARRLRQEADELRQEAAQAPRDPKKRVVGRRAPAVLATRAAALEAQARELEEQFEERARREGALPGWIRPKGR